MGRGRNPARHVAYFRHVAHRVHLPRVVRHARVDIRGRLLCRKDREHFRRRVRMEPRLLDGGDAGHPLIDIIPENVNVCTQSRLDVGWKRLIQRHLMPMAQVRWDVGQWPHEGHGHFLKMQLEHAGCNHKDPGRHNQHADDREIHAADRSPIFREAVRL